MKKYLILSACFFCTTLMASSKFGMETIDALESFIEDNSEEERLIVAQAYAVRPENERPVDAQATRSDINVRNLTCCQICMAGFFMSCYPDSQSQEEENSYAVAAIKRAQDVSDFMSNVLSCCQSHDSMQR